MAYCKTLHKQWTHSSIALSHVTDPLHWLIKKQINDFLDNILPPTLREASCSHEDYVVYTWIYFWVAP